jgi:ferredoxin--NADP+ reductase
MRRPLRVAVVGAGPAGLYAVGELLATPGLCVEIDVIERLPTPWGLIRAGVAPDHPEKKQIVDRLFHFHLGRPEVRFLGNVALGRDVQPAELSSWYDAVIYATGAAADTRLGIPGEDLAGSWSAREFVAWYNGHPDQRHLDIDLSCRRAVVIGNGNVALDLARMLMTPPAELAKTDIAEHALRALSVSDVREVVILGRRGCVHGAFHNPELEELAHLPDVQVSVEGDELPGEGEGALDRLGRLDRLDRLDWDARRKVATLRQLAQRVAAPGGRRIVFRFLSAPVQLLGHGRVEQVLVGRNRIEPQGDGRLLVRPTGDVSPLSTGLVLRAIGYRGSALHGLPFDERRGVVDHIGGRVAAQGVIVPGAYVTGWIKRGPRGIIGSNKKCATETVARLLEDDAAGRLPPAQKNADEVRIELLRRCPDLVGHDGWRRIDRAERLAGQRQGRPRIKMAEIDSLLSCAAGRMPVVPDPLQQLSQGSGA